MGFGILMTSVEVCPLQVMYLISLKPSLHIWKTGENAMYFIGLLWKLIKLIHIRCLILHLVCSIGTTNASYYCILLLMPKSWVWFLLTHSILCGKNTNPKVLDYIFSNICFRVYDNCAKNKNMLIPTFAEPSEIGYLFLRMAYGIILVWGQCMALCSCTNNMEMRLRNASSCDGKKSSSAFKPSRRASVQAITKLP